MNTKKLVKILTEARHNPNLKQKLIFCEIKDFIVFLRHSR